MVNPERVRALVEEGDPAGAATATIEALGPEVLGYLRALHDPDDAEDVFQETLIKVFTRLADLDDPGALRTWFWRVVSNECLMSRRGPRDPRACPGGPGLITCAPTP